MRYERVSLLRSYARIAVVPKRMNIKPTVKRWVMSIKPAVKGWVTKHEKFLKSVTFVVSYSLVAIAVIIYLGYRVAHQASTKNGPEFGLAMVTAAIGGLLVTGGVFDSARKREKSDLTYVGKWFLVAAVSSTMFELFLLPLTYINDSGVGYYVLLIALAVSLCSTTFALAWAVAHLIPLFWKL